MYTISEHQHYIPNASSLNALAILKQVINEASPLAPKYQLALRQNTRKLWEFLTSEKEERHAEYLGTPAFAHAYIRFFLPWNVYRLSAIFSQSNIALNDGDCIGDIGCGPFSAVIALYCARPDLHNKQITFYCVDRVEKILTMGKNIFESLALQMNKVLPNWNIKIIKEGFGAALPQKLSLFMSANLFNEFFWKEKGAVAERSRIMLQKIEHYLKEDAQILIMEPADPRGGTFISALRHNALARNWLIAGPCTHAQSCPLPGMFFEGQRQSEDSQHRVVMPNKRPKYPWCHISVDTRLAPEWLIKHSQMVGLIKEKVSFSYLHLQRTKSTVESTSSNTEIKLRILSEDFSLPFGRIGLYACSSQGYTLVTQKNQLEHFVKKNHPIKKNKKSISMKHDSNSKAKLHSGDLLTIHGENKATAHDKKSGAIIIDIAD